MCIYLEEGGGMIKICIYINYVHTSCVHTFYSNAQAYAQTTDATHRCHSKRHKHLDSRPRIVSHDTKTLMVARAGGLLASRRLMDSVVFDLCRGRGPGTVAQVVWTLCARARAYNAAVNGKEKRLARARTRTHQLTAGTAHTAHTAQEHHTVSHIHITQAHTKIE
jgi:hypothetical protein